MARTVRDSNLETRTARGKLKSSGQPYYRGLEPGLHLGYRKPRTGAGKWLARRNVEGTYSYHPLGTADDYSDADGQIILSYKQAQDAARKVQVGRGIGTVAEAIEAYLQALEADGRAQSSLRRTRYDVAASILPALSSVARMRLALTRRARWASASPSSSR